MSHISADQKYTGRLIIDKLVLENFKSYCGAVVIGPFHTRLSAIIGPNGSGKSNIIDAMLFVFGRRAAQLRHKKLTDLIHKSQKYQPTWARVSIYMARLQSDEVGDQRREDAFVVSREIHNDGKTKYIIGDQIVTHGQMVDFIKEHGIDLEHNRFLILQGEVEQFALMPCKKTKDNETGLLELLEDLIGSDQFLPAIEKEELTVETLSISLAAVQEKVTKAEGELANLLGPCREAFLFIRAQKALIKSKCDIKCKERLLLRKEMHSLTEKQNLVEEKVKELNTQQQIWKEKIDTASATLMDVEKNLQAISKEKVEIEKILKDSDMALEKSEMTVTSLKRLIITEKARLRELEKRAASNDQEAKDLVIKAAEAEKNLPALEKCLNDINTTLEKIDERFLAESRALVNQRGEEDRKRELKRIQYEEARSKATATENELELKTDRLVRLREQSEKLNESIIKMEADLKIKKQSMHSFAADRDRSKNHLNQYTQRLTDLSREKENIIKQRGELETKLDSRKLRTHSHSRIQLYHHLKQKFEESGNSLFRLGEWLLDKIECDTTELGVALTAAGFGEDVIVTESDEASEAIIDYVRKKGLGRVTCITLGTALRTFKKAYDAFIGVKSKGRFAEIEREAEFLIESIKCDDSRYWPVIFSRIRDTLLVRGDLEKAKKVAFSNPKERYKVVTLAGELIEKNGSMTGGQSHNYLQMRRAPPVLGDEEQKKVTTTLMNLEESLKKLIDEERRVKEAQNQYQRQYNMIIDQMTELKDEGKALSNRTQESKEILESLSKDLQVLEDDKSTKETIDALTAKLLKEKEEERNLKIILDKHIVRISEIDSQIRDLGGKSKLDLVKEKQCLADKIRESIDLIQNGSCKKAELQAKACQLIEVTIPETAKKIVNHEEEIKRLCLTSQELSAKKEGVLIRLQDVQQEKDQFGKAAKNTQEEIKGMEEKIKELNFQQRELKEQLADIEKQGRKLSCRIQEYTQDLERLRSDFDEFPIIDKDCISSIAEAEHVGIQDDQENIDPHTFQREMAEVKTKVKRENDETETQATNPLLMIEIILPDFNNDNIFETTELRDLQLNLFKAEQALSQFHRGNSNHDTTDSESQTGYLLNVSVVETFQTKAITYRKIKEELMDGKNDLNHAYQTVAQLRRERRDMFLKGFQVISTKLKELYQMLTRGGDAELEAKDPANPFIEGIEYSVRPPGKSWRIIQNLSGGEKTLASLALVFALHHFKPTPIYFLDEIDAALDPQNVVIIASYVAAYQAEQAQFVVVSLRSQLFERADRLIGVCKVNDITQTCFLDPDEFVQAERGTRYVSSGMKRKLER